MTDDKAHHDEAHHDKAHHDKAQHDKADDASTRDATPQPLPTKRRWARTPTVTIGLLVALLMTCFVLDRYAEVYEGALWHIVSYAAMRLAAIVLLVWFSFYSAYSRRVRMGVFATSVTAVATFLVLFEPVGVNAYLVIEWRARFRFEGGRIVRNLAEDYALQDADQHTQLEEVDLPGLRDFPQFLGPDRNSMITGVNLDPDWKSNPPVELWRREVGAGWSAFSVVGQRAVTQEQRGSKECVVCYDVATGKQLWVHSDENRFSTAMGGIGPLASPSIDQGRIYTVGPTGILNCLDLVSGHRHWMVNYLEDNGTRNTEWGRSGSPLIDGNRVIVSAGGGNGKSLVAYDKVTGERLWSDGDAFSAYASPTIMTLGGTRQILVVNEDVLTSHDAELGKVLWTFSLPGKSNANASNSQPVFVGKDRVLITKGYGKGAKLFKVSHFRHQWSTTIEWSKSSVLRTKFANVVVRDGYIYGLNDGLMECVNLENGKRRWKVRGEFGHGQILMADNLILIMTEDRKETLTSMDLEHDIVLVEATPEGYHELARRPVLTGKTWNNIALAGRYLLLRNAREAVCLKLPVKAAAGQ